MIEGDKEIARGQEKSGKVGKGSEMSKDMTSLKKQSNFT